MRVEGRVDRVDHGPWADTATSRLTQALWPSRLQLAAVRKRGMPAAVLFIAIELDPQASSR